jgi:DNA-binding GntR family transcriptional regulator
MIAKGRPTSLKGDRTQMPIQRRDKLKKKFLNDDGVKLAPEGFSPMVLTEQISKVLTEAILDGVLEPGTQLLETELQQQLGVSRSPIRETFRDLERKGLVVIVPRRGAFVKEITDRDVKENFPVRANLEGLAARLAFGNLSPEELGKMRTALEGMKQAGRQNDREGYRQNHQEFHDIFIKASDNRLLIDLLETLRMHRLWYFVSYRYQKLDFRVAIDVHEKILGLFENKNTDPSELEGLVKYHIDYALEKLFGTAGDSESDDAPEMRLDDKKEEKPLGVSAEGTLNKPGGRRKKLVSPK